MAAIGFYAAGFMVCLSAVGVVYHTWQLWAGTASPANNMIFMVLGFALQAFFAEKDSWEYRRRHQHVEEES